MLVNCFGGVNQSGAVVVGFFNQQLNQPLLETFSKVNKQRGENPDQLLFSEAFGERRHCKLEAHLVHAAALLN